MNARDLSSRWKMYIECHLKTRSGEKWKAMAIMGRWWGFAMSWGKVTAVSCFLLLGLHSRTNSTLHYNIVPLYNTCTLWQLTQQHFSYTMWPAVPCGSWTSPNYFMCCALYNVFKWVQLWVALVHWSFQKTLRNVWLIWSMYDSTNFLSFFS